MAEMTEERLDFGWSWYLLKLKSQEGDLWVVRARDGSWTTPANGYLKEACQEVERLRKYAAKAVTLEAEVDHLKAKARDREEQIQLFDVLAKNSKLDEQNRRYREDRALLETAAKRFPMMALPTFLLTEDEIRDRFVNEAIEEVALEGSDD